MVQGLVHGILEGNRRLRDQQAENIAVVAKAFKWSEEDARDELAHVHLSNLPENRAFFAGTIDSAGSFGGIFQSSVLAYGSVIKNPTDPARFVDTDARSMHSPSAACSPIRKSPSRRSAPRRRPRSRAIRCSARTSASSSRPNSSNLDRNAPQNQEYLADHQALPAGEPGLHRAAARSRRQRARRGIPPAGRRAAGARAWRSRPWSCRGSAPRRSATPCSRSIPEIDKSRVEAVGRGWEEPTASTDSGREPARRSAVVHH